MFEQKLYTYGTEEAKAIAVEGNLRKTERGNYVQTYVDMPAAIKEMRAFRKKLGLGNKVEIILKKEVVLRKQNDFQKTIRTNTCPFTRVTFGKFRGMNPSNGTAQWGAIELTPMRQFDLDDDNDAADWIILRLCSCIEGSVNGDKARDTQFWMFNDVRAVNVNNVARAREIARLTNLVDNMSGSEMLNLARTMGFTTIPGDEFKLRVVDVQGFLLDIVMQTPEEFVLKYKDSNRFLHEMIYAAVAIGTMEYSYTDGYKVLGNAIGATMEEATAYLRNDKNLFGHIKNAVTSTDVLAKILEDEKPDTATRKDAINASLEIATAVNDEQII
jgi:hypothetical protein